MNHILEIAQADFEVTKSASPSSPSLPLLPALLKQPQHLGFATAKALGKGG
jgi:hypothetical protein